MFKARQRCIKCEQEGSKARHVRYFLMHSCCVPHMLTKTCVPCCRSHHLYEATLTQTPPHKTIGGDKSETITYLAGGACLQRLLLYHTLHHFPGRMQARLLQELKRKLKSNPDVKAGIEQVWSRMTTS
jgi:hypothetical protein